MERPEILFAAVSAGRPERLLIAVVSVGRPERLFAAVSVGRPERLFAAVFAGGPERYLPQYLWEDQRDYLLQYLWEDECSHLCVILQHEVHLFCHQVDVVTLAVILKPSRSARSQSGLRRNGTVVQRDDRPADYSSTTTEVCVPETSG